MSQTVSVGYGAVRMAEHLERKREIISRRHVARLHTRQQVAVAVVIFVVNNALTPVSPNVTFSFKLPCLVAGWVDILEQALDCKVVVCTLHGTGSIRCCIIILSAPSRIKGRVRLVRVVCQRIVEMNALNPYIHRDYVAVLELVVSLGLQVGNHL